MIVEKGRLLIELWNLGQGCVLYPLLFNFYSETVFDRALSGIEDGIKINGQTVKNFRYGGDTVK